MKNYLNNISLILTRGNVDIKTNGRKRDNILKQDKIIRDF